MSRDILLASTNAAKLSELRALCAGLPCRVLSPSEVPFELPEVEEDGATFAENAAMKAGSASRAAAAAGRPDLLVLADDSGLEVEALGGAPGVLSARYADAALGTGEIPRPPPRDPGGDSTRDARNIALLLDRLRHVPAHRRGARFVCALALARAGRIVFACEGEVHGRILFEPQGTGGFGYDPVFFHPPSGATFAGLAPEAKGAVSHRGQALARLGANLGSEAR